MSNTTINRPAFSNNKTKILFKKGCERVCDSFFTLKKDSSTIHPFAYKYIFIETNETTSKIQYRVLSCRLKYFQATTFFYFKDLIEHLDSDDQLDWQNS